MTPDANQNLCLERAPFRSLSFPGCLSHPAVTGCYSIVPLLCPGLPHTSAATSGCTWTTLLVGHFYLGLPAKDSVTAYSFSPIHWHIYLFGAGDVSPVIWDCVWRAGTQAAGHNPLGTAVSFSGYSQESSFPPIPSWRPCLNAPSDLSLSTFSLSPGCFSPLCLRSTCLSSLFCQLPAGLCAALWTVHAGPGYTGM